MLQLCLRPLPSVCLSCRGLSLFLFRYFIGDQCCVLLCFAVVHWPNDSEHVHHLTPQRNEALLSINQQWLEARGSSSSFYPGRPERNANQSASRAFMTFHGEDIGWWMIVDKFSCSLEFPQIVLGGCSLELYGSSCWRFACLPGTAIVRHRLSHSYLCEAEAGHVRTILAH